MSTKEQKIIYVESSKIFADPNQPRKLFDATALARLVTSLNKYGILDPLKVELRDGKYVLIDGERRYRAAKVAGITKLPIIVLESESEQDKLISQFHLQEQHEGWTSIERANALNTLAKDMKIEQKALGKILGISERDVRNFISFGRVINKQKFSEANLSIDLSESLASLSSLAKRVYQKSFEEEFTPEMKQEFEGAIINKAISGQVTGRRDFAKLRDSFNADPKLIKAIIKGDKSSPDAMFLKSKAQSQYHLRNMMNSSGFVTSHAQQWLKNPVSGITKAQVLNLKSYIKTLSIIIEKFEKELNVEID